jgi:hypothetical protein
MSGFVPTGTPSDELPDVLAAGTSDVRAAFVSMAARAPDGHDRDYIEWHGLDHVPELHRLRGLRGGLRAVSTPACRAARAASADRFDAADHVMTYLFTDRSTLGDVSALAQALAAGGRMPVSLPAVEAGLYALAGTAAASRVATGAAVIPWRPARGVYVLIEEGDAPDDPVALADVPGVAGLWWYDGDTSPGPGIADTSGLRMTLCYLDDDPVATAGRLTDALDGRWASGDVRPLLAAPFHTVVPYEWGRHLPR